MRTLFMGGTKRGYLALQALVETGADIVGVISLRQDEHESEGFEQQIKALAEEAGLPHYETKWLKNRDYPALIATELRPDITFVVGCRVLIPREIYQIPPLGTLAAHDSLLPDYRGFAPLNWSILNGEQRTGVTLFYLTDLMDGGDIVAQKSVAIGPDDTAPVVYDRVCHATVRIILESYPLLVAGTAPRTGQNYSRGSLTCARTPGDGLIDWGQSTAVVYNRVRALTYPYPGAFTHFENRKLIIWTAVPAGSPAPFAGRIPGRAVSVSKAAGHVDVLTGDGVLRIGDVQLQGQPRAAAATVITSIRHTLGLRHHELVEAMQRLEQQLAELKASTTEAAHPATSRAASAGGQLEVAPARGDYKRNRS